MFAHDIILTWSKLCILIFIQICCQAFISSLGTNIFVFRASCLHMNFETVYDATQICQYVWCINNDYMQANGNVFHWSYRLGRFFRRTRVLQSVFIACDRVRACVHARVHACVSEIPKSSDYLLLFLHLSTFSHASSFSPSFSSSREPFAGSERSSSPATINLFREELSRSSGTSLGLAILRFRDSSKEHPLGVRARSRRQQNCRIIQL